MVLDKIDVTSNLKKFATNTLSWSALGYSIASGIFGVAERVVEGVVYQVTGNVLGAPIAALGIGIGRGMVQYGMLTQQPVHDSWVSM